MVSWDEVRHKARAILLEKTIRFVSEAEVEYLVCLDVVLRAQSGSRRQIRR
jgi:hypothetical protein